MIHVPVHDRGQRQTPEMPKLETNRPTAKMHLTGDVNERSESDSFQRYRMAAPERVQIDAVAVVRRDHGQTGETAFGGFRLMDDGQAAPAAEIQQTRHDHILTLSRGSRNQLTSERFARMMSARRSMSAWRGTLLPYASISGRSSAAVTRYAGSLSAR